MGDETSYIRITASCESRSSLVRLCKLGAELTAPRKKAVERLENLSWPAVSYTNHIHKCNKFMSRAERTHICKATPGSPSRPIGSGNVLVIKSAPMVARYPVEKRPDMYCRNGESICESMP